MVLEMTFFRFFYFRAGPKPKGGGKMSKYELASIRRWGKTNSIPRTDRKDDKVGWQFSGSDGRSSINKIKTE